MQEAEKQNRQEKAKEYEKYVKKVTPTAGLFWSMAKAFLVGGLISLLGQVIINFAMAQGLDRETAGTWCSVILVLLSVLLTGFGLYARLADFAGAGTLVPITGFANSVAAPAIEYQTEGQVFGIGCKIFTIAGPVILYGVLTSWILGLICWIFQLF